MNGLARKPRRSDIADRLHKIPDRIRKRRELLVRRRSPAELAFIKIIGAERFLLEPDARCSKTAWPGVRVYQQYPIGGFYADFAIRKLRQVFEIDGKQHQLPRAVEYDTTRDGVIRRRGWNVTRIPAKAVFTQPEAVRGIFENRIGRQT